MKKTILPLVCTALAMSLQASVPVAWKVDVSRAQSATFDAYRGETLDLSAALYNAGAAFAPSASDVALYWQTNGMGQLWWSAPASLSSNVVSATWAPSNDVGAAVYNCFIGSAATSYRAAFRLRLVASPGAVPAELELPVKTFDFNAVTVLNPPYYTQAETDTAIATATNALAAAAATSLVVATNALSASVSAAAAAATNHTDSAVNDVATNSIHSLTVVNPYFTGTPQTFQGEGVEIGFPQLTFKRATAGGRLHLNATYKMSVDSTDPDRHTITWPEYTTEIDISDDAKAEKSSISRHLKTMRARTNLVYETYTPGSPTSSNHWFVVATTNDAPWTFTPEPGYEGSFWISEDLSFDGFILRLSAADTYRLDCSDGSATFTLVDGMATATVANVEYTIRGYTGVAVSDTLALTSDLTSATNALSSAKQDVIDDIDTIRSDAALGAAASAAVESLQTQVTTIGAHLNAEDARYMVTNYNSAINMPEANAEVKVDGSWIRIWSEMTRWNWALTNYLPRTYYNKTEVDAALADKADLAWGYYDSHTGNYAPDGYTWLSSPYIAIAGGLAYQRTVTTEGAVWVLTSNGLVTETSGVASNGFFRVSDDEGGALFEIVKGDKRTVGATAVGISTEVVDGVTHVTIPYVVESAEHPTVEVCTNPADAEWYAEDDADCPANVSWSGSSGAWSVEVWGKTPLSQLFVKASYETGGETYIRNNAPVGMSSIYLNGVKYTLGTATISGHTVLTLTPAN